MYMEDTQSWRLPEGATVQDALELVAAQGLEPSRVWIEYAGCGTHEIDLVHYIDTVKAEPKSYTKFGPGTQHVKRQQEIAERIRQDNLAMAEEATWD